MEETSVEAARRGAVPTLLMSSRRRLAVTAGVLMGMFLAALGATVVSTAMPTVIASLGGLNHYSWVFSAYLITSTVTVPVWGKLSDLYGRRLFYQLGIAVFLLGTVLSAGLASQLGEMARAGRASLTSERATELAANPNALIEPVARAAMPPDTLDALQDALAASIRNVFWVATVLAGLALLVTFRLPRGEGGGDDVARPTDDSSSVEACERLLIAELAPLDSEHEPEPVTARGD